MLVTSTVEAAAPRRTSLLTRKQRPASPRGEAPVSAPSVARRPDGPEFRAAVEAALAELRPRLQRDGGDCELVGIDDGVVKVRLKGACVGCQLASMTLMGVRMKLMEKLGFPVKIAPVEEAR